MRLIGNVLWFLLSGLWLAIGYAIPGLVLCLTIVGIPFGLQCFKIAGYCLWPFGRAIVRRPTAGSPSLLGNVIWVLLAGFLLALGHLAAAALLLLSCLLIVTIPICLPFAIANLRLTVIALWPFGREVVDADRVGPGHAVGVPAPGR